MGLLGLRLGMYNLVVLPTILSVSVDSVIHLYHRRMELGAGIVVMFTLLPWMLEKLCPVEPQGE